MDVAQSKSYTFQVTFMYMLNPSHIHAQSKHICYYDFHVSKLLKHCYWLSEFVSVAKHLNGRRYKLCLSRVAGFELTLFIVKGLPSPVQKGDAIYID